MEIKPILRYSFDMNLYAEEVKMKGYCNDVSVILPDKLEYNICFYDPVRLQQDIEDEVYIAIPNLVVVQDVTQENMEYAVYEMWKDGYFDNLKPI